MQDAPADMRWAPSGEVRARRAPTTPATSALARCHEHVSSLKDILMSPAKAERGAGVRDVGGGGIAGALSTGGSPARRGRLVAQIHQLKKDNLRLAMKLGKQRERQRHELRELEDEIAILEDGMRFVREQNDRVYIEADRLATAQPLPPPLAISVLAPGSPGIAEVLAGVPPPVPLPPIPPEVLATMPVPTALPPPDPAATAAVAAVPAAIPAPAIAPLNDDPNSLMHMVQGLMTRHVELEAEVERLKGQQGPGAGAPAGTPGSATVTRAGIPWSREGDELLRRHFMDRVLPQQTQQQQQQPTDDPTTTADAEYAAAVAAAAATGNDGRRSPAEAPTPRGQLASPAQRIAMHRKSLSPNAARTPLVAGSGTGLETAGGGGGDGDGGGVANPLLDTTLENPSPTRILQMLREPVGQAPQAAAKEKPRRSRSRERGRRANPPPPQVVPGYVVQEHGAAEWPPERIGVSPVQGRSRSRSRGRGRGGDATHEKNRKKPREGRAQRTRSNGGGGRPGVMSMNHSLNEKVEGHKAYLERHLLEMERAAARGVTAAEEEAVPPYEHTQQQRQVRRHVDPTPTGSQQSQGQSRRTGTTTTALDSDDDSDTSSDAAGYPVRGTRGASASSSVSSSSSILRYGGRASNHASSTLTGPPSSSATAPAAAASPPQRGAGGAPVLATSPTAPIQYPWHARGGGAATVPDVPAAALLRPARGISPPRRQAQQQQQQQQQHEHPRRYKPTMSPPPLPAGLRRAVGGA